MNISIKMTVLCSVAVGLLCVQPVHAGPGPQQVFVPVTSAKAAEALKPGTKIATTCPSCGAVSISKVTKEHTHMTSFECPVCKHSFEVKSAGGGKATLAHLVCKDPKTGKMMSLKMCAEMH